MNCSRGILQLCGSTCSVRVDLKLKPLLSAVTRH